VPGPLSGPPRSGGPIGGSGRGLCGAPLFRLRCGGLLARGLLREAAALLHVALTLGFLAIAPPWLSWP